MISSKCPSTDVAAYKINQMYFLAAECRNNPFMYFTDIGYSEYDEFIQGSVNKAIDNNSRRKRSKSELWFLSPDFIYNSVVPKRCYKSSDVFLLFTKDSKASLWKIKNFNCHLDFCQNISNISRYKDPLDTKWHRDFVSNFWDYPRLRSGPYDLITLWKGPI